MFSLFSRPLFSQSIHSFIYLSIFLVCHTSLISHRKPADNLSSPQTLSQYSLNTPFFFHFSSSSSILHTALYLSFSWKLWLETSLLCLFFSNSSLFSPTQSSPNQYGCFLLLSSCISELICAHTHTHTDTGALVSTAQQQFIIILSPLIGCHQDP